MWLLEHFEVHNWFTLYFRWVEFLRGFSPPALPAIAKWFSHVAAQCTPPQECVIRVPISYILPNPCFQTTLFVSLIRYEKWYLVIFFISISLNTREVENFSYADWPFS